MKWDPHIFVAFHWCSEIKVLDVDSHKFCILGGECAVDKELSSGEVSGLGTNIKGIVYLVASDSPSDASRVCFFWPHGGNDAEVSGFATVG